MNNAGCVVRLVELQCHIHDGRVRKRKKDIKGGISVCLWNIIEHAFIPVSILAMKVYCNKNSTQFSNYISVKIGKTDLQLSKQKDNCSEKDNQSH